MINFIQILLISAILGISSLPALAQSDSALKTQLLMQEPSSDHTNTDSVLALSRYRAKHTIFAELLGAGGLVSVNYENRFEKIWGFRIGIGYMATPSWYDNSRLGSYYTTNSVVTSNFVSFHRIFIESIITMPMVMSWMTDDQGLPGHFECEFGLVPWLVRTYELSYYGGIDPGHYIAHGVADYTDPKLDLNLLIPISVGYRYQPPEGGLFFRICYTQMVVLGVNMGTLPWLQLSIGYSF